MSSIRAPSTSGRTSFTRTRRASAPSVASTTVATNIDPSARRSSPCTTAHAPTNARTAPVDV